MRKRIISMMLVICMVLMLVPTVVFAETTSNGNDYVADSAYTQACESIDSEYSYTKRDLGVTYTPEGTTFKVWAPTATEVSVNLYATGSDSEEGAEDLDTYPLEKLMDGGKWTGVWKVFLEGD